MAKRVIRVAAMTASASELVTTAAARGAIRGLGDRTRLERQRSGGGSGGGSRDVRWVTVYVGVGRCDAKQHVRSQLPFATLMSESPSQQFYINGRELFASIRSFN